MRWRARTIVHLHCALRASRPQLKRDPLDSRVTMVRATASNVLPVLLGAAFLTVPGKTSDAPAPSAASEPRPIVVLLRHSVWFPFVNLPLFVLYEDGRVIIPRERTRGIPQSYQIARVPDVQRALSELGIKQELFELQAKYDFRPNVTDQETVFLYVWHGDSLTRVAVRAGLGADDRLISAVPSAFRTIYDRLTHFTATEAVPWHPESLEVAAWGYEYAPDDPPLDWPATWPDMNSPGSTREKQPGIDELWRFRIPYGYRSELEHLLTTRREKQAIRIAGRKWAVGFRLPFPGEARWRRYFPELEED